MSNNDYPRLWKLGLIQEKVRLRANHHCEQCDMQFIEGTNIAKSAKNYLGKPMVGGCHHIDMNRQNCVKANLVYLCQSCHWLIHLYGWIPGKMIPLRWKGNMPKWIIERGLAYLPHRQLSLFGGEL